MTKRFYKAASVVNVDGGYGVELDGKGVKTPAGSALVMPTERLALAVAAEWNAQGDEIDPKSMSMMPLVGTAIDRVPDVRDGLIEGLLRYGDTDLLCYRAGHPDDLVELQNEAWQPLLDWAADTFGARLIVTTGVSPVEQDPAALAAFQEILESYDNWGLTALGELVAISGSLVVGLALVKGHLTVDQALGVCHVDEDHQIQKWGEDFEAIARRKNVTADLTAAYRYFEML